MLSRLMSTINIAALTILLVTIAGYLYIQPKLQARPASYSQAILQDDSLDELVDARPWLVVYEMNPSPVFSDNQQRLALDSQQVDMKLPTDESKRIQAILQALKIRMSPDGCSAENAATGQCSEVEASNSPTTQSFWPDVLGIPEVFLTDLGGGKTTVILNFPLEGEVQITVQQEEALKASIAETLLQNNINNSLWLINDEAQPLFLQHIALQSDLQ